MISRLFVGAVVATALSTTAALAQQPAAAGCTGNSQLPGDILAQNTFWDLSGYPQGVTLNVGGGSAQFQAPANQGFFTTYQGSLFSDADICVTESASPVTNATNQSQSAAVAGIVFWGQSVGNFFNYYEVFTTADGAGGIFRVQNGQSLMLIPFAPVTTLKTGANAANAVRVTLKGNTVTAYFNGTLFKTIPAVQPSGGGLFGFEFDSESAVANTWTFSNLKITDTPQ